MNTAAIFGGTQGIGLAITKELLKKSFNVFVSYRSTSDLTSLSKLAELFPGQLSVLPVEIENEAHYKDFFNAVAESTNDLKYCINCIGVLSGGDLQPERRLEDFELKALLHVFMVNTSPTLLIAKHAKKIIRSSTSPIFASLSAKVGSIADNKMGGWYSYRISKSALNMAIKNISLELSRINKQSITLAIHPGTTDSNLSKPFLDSAAKRYKIHSTEESAKNIIAVLESSTPEDANGKFYSWNGEKLHW